MDQRLIAYIVPSEPGSPSVSELREHCGRKLPRHLLPSAYVPLRRIPMLANGKVDREQLSELVVDLRSNEHFIAPRTPQEVRVALAFERVLNVPVGVQDDFFALGGHSLHAVAASALLEQAGARRLTMHDLIAAPTVEQLACRLNSYGYFSTEPILVPMSNSDATPPLYLVHPISGSTGCYLDVARHLSPEVSVVGLQADGLENDREPLNDIRQLAERYVRAIRRDAKVERYRIGGWSFGAAVAFEMACQLREADADVEWLVLMDPAPSFSETSIPLDDDRAATAAILLDASMRARIAEIDELNRVLGGDSPDAIFRSAAEWAERVGAFPPGLGEHTLRRRVSVLRAHVKALANYRPRIYAGRTLFIEASKEGRFAHAPHKFWAPYLKSPWVVETVHGTHETILGAGAPVVANKLKQLLLSC